MANWNPYIFIGIFLFIWQYCFTVILIYIQIYLCTSYDHHMNGLSELINWIVGLNNISNNSLKQKTQEMCPFKYTWEMGNGSQLTPIGDTMAARTVVWTFKSMAPIYQLIKLQWPQHVIYKLSQFVSNGVKILFGLINAFTLPLW